MDLFGQCLIPLKQFCHAVGFGGLSGNETVRTHNGTVVLLMGVAEFGRHSHFIIEISKAAVRILSSCIQNGLGGLLNADFSTKEINMLTRQSLQTIYQRKTQVRQKLSLAEAEDITTAII